MDNPWTKSVLKFGLTLQNVGYRRCQPILHIRQDMAVSIHGDGDAGMSQGFLYNLRIDASEQSQRCEGVAQAVVDIARSHNPPSLSRGLLGLRRFFILALLLSSILVTGYSATN